MDKLNKSQTILQADSKQQSQGMQYVPQADTSRVPAQEQEKRPGFAALMKDAYHAEIPSKEGRYDQCYYDFCDCLEHAILNVGSGSNLSARTALQDCLKSSKDGKCHIHVGFDQAARKELVFSSALAIDAAIKKAFGYDSGSWKTALRNLRAKYAKEGDNLDASFYRIGNKTVKNGLGLNGEYTLTDENKNTATLKFDPNSNYLNVFLPKDVQQALFDKNMEIDVSIYKKELRNAISENVSASNLVLQSLIHWGHAAPGHARKAGNALVNNIELFKRQLRQGYWDDEAIDLLEANAPHKLTIYPYIYVKGDLGTAGKTNSRDWAGNTWKAQIASGKGGASTPGATVQTTPSTTDVTKNDPAPVKNDPAPVKNDPVPAASEVVYTVKSGDTLSKIAGMYNVAGGYQALASYNGIRNPNIINVGQKIRIPGTKVEEKVEKPDTTAGQTLDGQSGSSDGVAGTALNVELKAQQTHYTCGFASGAMCAQQYSGKSVGENDIYSACKNISASQTNYVWCVTQGVNSILKAKGAGQDYKYKEKPQSANAFANGIKQSLDKNAPVILHVTPNDAQSLYGYSSGGHYVVATGVYKKDGQLRIKLNDPYSATMQKTSVPTGSQHDATAADVYASMKNHLIMHQGAAFASSENYEVKNAAETGDKKAGEQAEASDKKVDEPAETQNNTLVAASEVVHIVKSGDTLSKIASMYNVAGGYQALASYNGIQNPNIISVGQKIRIPGGKAGEKVLPKKPTPGAWRWPSAAYKVTSEFGPRDPLALTNGGTSSNFHRGIDIAGGKGTAIYAAKGGTATKKSWDQGGYGNWVQIDHGDGTYSRYAHMSSVNFSGTKNVESGDQIGAEGATGGVTGPHLHFEIRVGGTDRGNAVNPRNYISP